MIEFNNLEKINESIEITAKKRDVNRKKRNAPFEFTDYDDNGEINLLKYMIPLEDLKIANTYLYELVIELSKKTQAERERRLKEINQNTA